MAHLSPFPAQTALQDPLPTSGGHPGSGSRSLMSGETQALPLGSGSALRAWILVTFQDSHDLVLPRQHFWVQTEAFHLWAPGQGSWSGFRSWLPSPNALLTPGLAWGLERPSCREGRSLGCCIRSLMPLSHTWCNFINHLLPVGLGTVTLAFLTGAFVGGM